MGIGVESERAQVDQFLLVQLCETRSVDAREKGNETTLSSNGSYWLVGQRIDQEGEGRKTRRVIELAELESLRQRSKLVCLSRSAHDSRPTS